MNNEVMETAIDLFGESNMRHLELMMEKTTVDADDIELATRVMKDGVGLLEPMEGSLEYGLLATTLVDLSARGGKWGRAAMLAAHGNANMALDIAQGLQDQDMAAFFQARTALQNIYELITSEAAVEGPGITMEVGKLNGILNIMTAK